jgi:crotonobetainyl-CoA:carnitine CoA-transferase CaiB-like acyl-CoA transferase
MSDDRLPLSGLRVVDLTQVQFGPCATQVLGDFGAEIVKVERPHVGDISRSTDPFIVENNGESAYFMALNRNKRSLAIDLSKTEGRNVVRDLVRGADVFVHNFRPGVAERLGFSYEVLSADNPRLIYASGSGFGETGPLAHKAGQDLLAQSLSGLASRNVALNGKPQLYPTALGDFSSGMILAQGILLALYSRERSGRGQSIHICLLDTLITMQQQEVTQWLLRGRETNWVTQNLIDIFETKDGAVTLVGVFRPNPLGAVCEALGLNDLSKQPQYETLAKQMQNRGVLLSELAQGFSRFTTDECLQRLDAGDILCAPVLGLDEALKQPQVDANGILLTMDHPIHGSVTTPGNPLRMSGVEQIASRAPPTLGQHSDEILSEMGYSPHAVDAMRKAAIIQ